MGPAAPTEAGARTSGPRASGMAIVVVVVVILHGARGEALAEAVGACEVAKEEEAQMRQAAGAQRRGEVGGKVLERCVLLCIERR